MNVVVPIDPMQFLENSPVYPPTFNPDAIFASLVLSIERAMAFQNQPIVKQYHADIDAGKTEPPPMLQAVDVDVLWDWHRGLRPDSNWPEMPKQAFLMVPAQKYNPPPPPPAYTLGPPIPSIKYNGIQYYAVPGDNPAVPFGVPFALAGGNYVKVEIAGFESPFSPAPDKGVIGWVKLS